MVFIKGSGEISEGIYLPPEALGEAKLSLAGGRLLLVENHRGLREYGPERIVVSVKGGIIVISGSALELGAMNKRELVIRGHIAGVEWQR